MYAYCISLLCELRMLVAEFFVSCACNFIIWLILCIDNYNLIAQNATGGAIRAIMMCIHAYFNIWCEARAGWSVFMKRRSAVHKISALPEATPAQLQAFDDVCAICYQVSSRVVIRFSEASINNSLLSGNVLGKDNALPSLLPRCLPAQVALCPGPLSAVSRNNDVYRQSRGEYARSGYGSSSASRAAHTLIPKRRECSCGS